MRSVSTALFMFVTGIVGASNTDTQDKLVDKLVNKLIGRAQKEGTLEDGAYLDSTALGKPGHVAVPSGVKHTAGVRPVAASAVRGPESVTVRVASQLKNNLQQRISEYPAAIMKSVSGFVETQKARNKLLQEIKRQPSSQVGDITKVTSDIDPATMTYPKFNVDAAGVQVLNAEPPVYMVDNFLTPSECDDLIDVAKSGELESIKYNGRFVLLDRSRLWPLLPMLFLSAVPGSHALSAPSFDLSVFERYLQVLGPNALLVGSMLVLVPRIAEFITPFLSKDSGAQATFSKWTGLSDLDKQHPAANAHESLLRKAEDLCYAPRTRFERVKVTQYQKGQRQAVHSDAYPPAEPGKEDEYFASGGQRLAQCLVYLNDVPKEDGGSTKFFHPSVNLAVQPKKGSALVFFPAFADGTEDTRMMHSGEAYIGDASKWTAGSWIHQTDIQPAPQSSH